MNHTPSIKDVAEAAGVSIKTVSRVINNEPNVRDKTKQRVQKAIDALAYTPSVSARALAGNKTYTMVVLCIIPRGDYFANLHFSALAACQRRGYRLQVLQLEDYYELDEPTQLERLDSLIKRPFPDGIILTPPFCDQVSVLSFLRDRNIPFVRISPKDTSIAKGPAVFFDERQAAKDIVTYLIGRGHRRIALVKGYPSHAGTILRTEGYMDALQSHGIEIDPMLIFQGDFLFPSGLDAGKQILSLTNPATAVFASNDEMAAGVNMAVHAAGLSVPADMSVVGFDDHVIAESTWPPLTTIRQPLEEMATTAAELLMNGNGEDELNRDCQEAHSYELVERNSVGSLE